MPSYPCESKRDLIINARSSQGNTYCQSTKCITMLEIFLKIQSKAFSIVFVELKMIDSLCSVGNIHCHFYYILTI